MYCLYAPVRRTNYANEHIFHVPHSRVEAWLHFEDFIHLQQATYM